MIPAWDRRQLSVGTFHVRFLHAGVDQPNNAPAQDEKVTDLELLDKIFLDRP